MDPSAVEPSVRLIPLGGLGEIGLNMMLIESGDDIVAVDCGLMFPDDELPGVDYVIPDFSYVLAKREHFHGVVLTHGHEDHIGALPYLLRSVGVPVYATALTRAFVSEKLREHALPAPADLRLMRPREPFTLGPFELNALELSNVAATLASGRTSRSWLTRSSVWMRPSPTAVHGGTYSAPTPTRRCSNGCRMTSR